MTALAVVFLFVYGGPVIWPRLSPWAQTAAEAANIVIWAIFAVDLGVRLWLAENRTRWLLRHPIDVLTVVLPLLRRRCHPVLFRCCSPCSFRAFRRDRE